MGLLEDAATRLLTAIHEYDEATVQAVLDESLAAFGLGANTPLATISEAAKSTQPAVTVLVSFDRARLEAESSAIRRLATQIALVLSGPGATKEISTRLRVPPLDGDLMTAAHDTARGP